MGVSKRYDPDAPYAKEQLPVTMRLIDWTSIQQFIARGVLSGVPIFPDEYQAIKGLWSCVKEAAIDADFDMAHPELKDKPPTEDA
jgi:hypothetical protein